MKNFRWQLLIIFTTGLIVGLLLYFQQDDTGPVVESTPSPISGGIYTEALVGQIMRLNPLLDHYNQVDRDVDRLLFSGLVKFDTAGLPQPDLAQAWSFSSDGTRYTFSLRPLTYWHDGTQVSAQDVLYTVSLLQSGSAFVPEDLRIFWSEIQVNAVSDSVVEFLLPETFAPFLDYLNFALLPAHLLGNLTLDELVNHPFNMSPVGTGPYKFNRFIVENGEISGVDLIANLDYYNGSPYIDEVVFQYYPTEQAAWEAYKAGEVDGIGAVSTDILTEVLAEPGLNLYSTREPRLSMVFLNLNIEGKEFLQDSDFRRALMLGINRQNILDKVMMGQGVLGNGPILPGNWAFYADQGSFTYDPDGARQLLASLKMKPGEDNYLMTSDDVEVRIILMVQNDPVHTKIGEFIKQNWESIGVAVDLLPMAYDEIVSSLQAHSYEAALMDIDFSGTPDPDPYPFWAQSQVDGGQNFSQWSNQAASEYLEQARVTNDMVLRTKLYRNFQVLFHEEIPSLPLFYPIYNYAVKDTIKGVSIGPIYEPSDRFALINTWYILSSSDTASTPTPPSGE